jgi:hypothetical protein
MAIHDGTGGSIRVGSDVLAELKSFNVDQKSDPIETTNMASTAKTFVAGKTSWSGSCDCFWSDDDTAQGTLTAGAQVTITFYPTAGKSFTGSAHVDSLTIDSSTDDMINASFSFTGTGALTYA